MMEHLNTVHIQDLEASIILLAERPKCPIVMGSLLCALAVAVVMDDYIGSFARKRDCDRLADPVVRTGHQVHLSHQFRRAFLSRRIQKAIVCPVVGNQHPSAGMSARMIWPGAAMLTQAVDATLLSAIVW
jgi:hypothetical protein